MIVELGTALVVAAVGAVLATLGIGEFNVWAALSVVLVVWLLMGLVRDLRQRLAGAATASQVRMRLTPSYLGMLCAHAGFGLVVIGAVFVTQFSTERDLRMEAGDSVELGDYGFRLDL